MDQNASRPPLIVVGRPRGTSNAAGVLLHGRGIGAEGKVDLAARLGHLTGIRWLVPGMDIKSWYPNRYCDPRESNEPHLTEAVERCHFAVEEAGEDGRLGPERLVIAGFSQGACLALEHALRYPRRCGTMIVFTGALMGPPDSWRTSGGSLEGVRILLTGSDADEWITEESSRETARALKSLGADVRLRIYKGRPHIVNDDEVNEARLLLEDLI